MIKKGWGILMKTKMRRMEVGLGLRRRGGDINEKEYGKNGGRFRIQKGWGILVKKNKGRMEVVVCLRRRRGYLWHTI